MVMMITINSYNDNNNGQNDVTGETTWEHPMDPYYRGVLARLRRPAG